ncbi:MAG: DUF2442 domain-containing protein [bacterium]
MKLVPGVEVNIVRAESAGNYRLWLTFSDNHKTLVDFETFLERSMNPQTRQFLEEERFLCFRLEYGNLVWGDYEMCFPIEELYDGQEGLSSELAVAEEKMTYGQQNAKKLNF